MSLIRIHTIELTISNPVAWPKANHSHCHHQHQPRGFDLGLPVTTILLGLTFSIFSQAIPSTMVPLGLGGTTALAQSTQDDRARNLDLTIERKFLFVNPVTGNDSSGDGTQDSPLKTITQALQAAQANTVIVLSSGIYSSDMGETFPLLLKPGIKLQGNPRTRGHDVVIRGGGTFVSATAASHDVLIVGADQTIISGVTLNNTNPEGYGLWLEVGSVLVEDNTLTGNTKSGIAVEGNSTPTIRSNYFYNNKGNGLSIYGTSNTQVDDNVFENNDLGILIAENVAPHIVNNRITGNKNGVVVETNAQPFFQNNLIENSQLDGLVLKVGANPDWGNSPESTNNTLNNKLNNTFRGNGRFDINNQESEPTVIAFGNQLGQETKSEVNSVKTENDIIQKSEVETPAFSKPAVSKPASTPDASDNQAVVMAENSNNSQKTKPNSQENPTTPSQVVPSQPPAEKEPTKEPTSAQVSAASFPVPSSLESQASTSTDNISKDAALNNSASTESSRPAARSQTQSQETSQTQQPSDARTQRSHSQPLTPLTLKVIQNQEQSSFEEPTSSPKPGEDSSSFTTASPSQEVIDASSDRSKPTPAAASTEEVNVMMSMSSQISTPVNQNTSNQDTSASSNSGSSIPVFSTSTQSNSEQRGPQENNPTSALPSQGYRILVNAESEQQQDLMRSLIPDSFLTSFEGRTVMQAGLFTTLENIDRVLKLLSSYGLSTTIVPLNY
ncbi:MULTISPECIES: DUF1565 domain-containing protein [unclassified Moorena]|uniref:DUF1565 domain-containing protein n=2 Tax=Moorena TaxID=1155738 RepID=UPI0013BD1164|nr:MULTISPECIES: DUF1565 domain-containing protein [unclassified Moorena]NEP31423.1 DUF1565 domain-containing protein [Moorena sp. SIO3B2]NEP66468.1 DUF1565 domain-containing protein [Moorena sp. SIO3A5]NER90152.1 DUF1565 domain-containing protein [Moorena sp. SIO3A2]